MTYPASFAQDEMAFWEAYERIKFKGGVSPTSEMGSASGMLDGSTLAPPAKIFERGLPLPQLGKVLDFVA